MTSATSMLDNLDQAPFTFSPTAGIAVAFMVGFLVFGVALDLRWEQFRRVMKSPRAPVIGLAGQFVLLPAAAFVVGLGVDAPSVALGLLLVASCPGGALSNYFTALAKGDVATSISMTAVSTALSIIATPVVFGVWAQMNPETSGLLHEIGIDPKRVLMVLLIMVVVPVGGGMLISARRPDLATAIRTGVRRVSIGVFATVVVAVLGTNASILFAHATVALPPVLATFGIAVAGGWGLARATRLGAAQRRAITLEVAMQNVGLALGTAVAFFPSLAGVAVTAALWGVVHLAGGFALAAAWSRAPT